MFNTIARHQFWSTTEKNKCVKVGNVSRNVWKPRRLAFQNYNPLLDRLENEQNGLTNLVDIKTRVIELIIDFKKYL